MNRNLPLILLLTVLFALPLVSLAHAPLATATEPPPPPPAVPLAAPTTYYVSSSQGSDTNSGTTTSAPLQTIAAVNALELQPGDQVLFKCGDTWRAEMLQITASGTADSPVLFGAYPEGCSDQPVISGAQPIEGWTQHEGNIYVANLSAGSNAGLFPAGINQLFRSGERLMLGRWPNLDANDDGGYSLVDSSPDDFTLVDTDLPVSDWSGAVLHIKAMRWYILNRVVASSSGSSLTLETETTCWGGCGDPDPADPDTHGWGYFLNNHLSTLDQDGEWYYDDATSQVYLYSESGTPQDIEGSVILPDADEGFAGGIILGIFEEGGTLSHVIVENLAIRNWFANGITYPRNLHSSANQNIVIRNNTIENVDAIGMNLATWVYQPVEGDSGWRGGNAIEVVDNVIDGANHFGIHTYARNSLFEGNTVRNIGMVENLGASGLGCGTTSGGGICTENGDGIRLKVDDTAFSAYGNTFRYNRVERTAYCGFDIFGSNNTLEYNFIREACFVKGDCGGIRTFGRTNLTETPVYDLTIRNNIIVDTIGNTDGANSTYKPLFGMGVYIDSYSRNVMVSGNTIINSSVDGILYQRSTGSVLNNTLYNNNTGTMSRGQVGFYKEETAIAEMRGNILYGLTVSDQFQYAKTLVANATENLLASDDNMFFQPYRDDHIAVDGNKTLAEWQAYSGMDASSTTNWFTLEEGEAPRSRLFYNDTQETVVRSLGNQRYLDLEQNPVVGSITLEPFTSLVLIDDGETPVSLAPDALDFGEQPLDTTSDPQTIVVQNDGTSPVTLNSIALDGDDYSQTNDCPTAPETLAGGAQCEIAVSFAPTSVATRTGTLTVTDADGIAYTATLTGTGTEVVAGRLLVSPDALDFGSQMIGTTSTTQTIVVSNTSELSRTLSNIVTTGDYSIVTDCPTAPESLGGFAHCTLSVRFTPTAVGSREGEVTVTHDGPNTPMVIALSGTGVGALAFTPDKLDFGNVPLDTSSPSQTITLENTGTVSVTLTSITLDMLHQGSFALEHNCPTAPDVLAPGETCSIVITFTPTERGDSTGTVTIVHDSDGSPITLPLAGESVSREYVYLPLVQR